MRAEEDEHAHRRLIQAFYLDGTLAIFATGQVPVPCYEVRIERILPATDPPQFAVIQRKLAGIYPQAATPYAISCLFGVSSCPRLVSVSHAEGRDTVTVYDVRGDNTLPTTVEGVPIPYVFPPSASHGDRNDNCATGYSAALDFKEALSEAVRALPAVDDPFSDYPRTIRIVDVGIEEGGVAKFHHLFVRVQRRTAVPAGAPLMDNDA